MAPRSTKPTPSTPGPRPLSGRISKPQTHKSSASKSTTLALALLSTHPSHSAPTKSLSTLSKASLRHHISAHMDELLDLKQDFEDEEAVDQLTESLANFQGPDEGLGSALAEVLEGMGKVDLDGEELPLLPEESEEGSGDEGDEDGTAYEDTMTAAAETEWGAEEDGELDAAWFPLPDDEVDDLEDGDEAEEDDEESRLPDI